MLYNDVCIYFTSVKLRLNYRMYKTLPKSTFLFSIIIYFAIQSYVRLFCFSGVCYLPVCFGQLLRYAHKRIVNIMKAYIERNKMQVELI